MPTRVTRKPAPVWVEPAKGRYPEVDVTASPSLPSRPHSPILPSHMSAERGYSSDNEVGPRQAAIKTHILATRTFTRSPGGSPKPRYRKRPTSYTVPLPPSKSEPGMGCSAEHLGFDSLPKRVGSPDSSPSADVPSRPQSHSSRARSLAQRLRPRRGIEHIAEVVNAKEEMEVRVESWSFVDKIRRPRPSSGSSRTSASRGIEDVPIGILLSTAVVNRSSPSSSTLLHYSTAVPRLSTSHADTTASLRPSKRAVTFLDPPSAGPSGPQFATVPSVTDLGSEQRNADPEKDTTDSSGASSEVWAYDIDDMNPVQDTMVERVVSIESALSHNSSRACSLYGSPRDSCINLLRVGVAAEEYYAGCIILDPHDRNVGFVVFL